MSPRVTRSVRNITFTLPVNGWTTPTGASTTTAITTSCTVSYTHLDVYKRQELAGFVGALGMMLWYSPILTAAAAVLALLPVLSLIHI